MRVTRRRRSVNATRKSSTSRRRRRRQVSLRLTSSSTRDVIAWRHRHVLRVHAHRGHVSFDNLAHFVASPRAHKVTVQNFDPSVDWHNYSFFPVPQFDIIPRWTDKFSTVCDRALLPRPVSARDNNCGRLRPKYVERSAASQTAGFCIRLFSFCAAGDADFWDVLLYFRCLLILRFGTLRLWQAGRPLPCDVWHTVYVLYTELT